MEQVVEVKILPIVIGALEIIPKSLEKHLNELNVEVKSFKCKPKFYLIVQESSRKSWSSKEKSIERPKDVKLKKNNVRGPRSPCRCSPAETLLWSRKKWSKEVIIVECYYRSYPLDECTQRMYRESLEWGSFGDATEQRICDQVRAIV